MIDELAADLLAESAALDAVVAGLDDAGWETATPAPGWTVRDQLTHLAFFDEALRLAIVDPEAFAVGAEEAAVDVDAYVDRVTRAHRAMPGPAVLEWLHHARAELLDAVRAIDPATRIPWYGPAMSAASSLTARLMETWAHGQDVVDALGAHRPATDRLRHVAFLGFRALPNSYVARDRPVPDAPVRVELATPSGGSWTFGPEGAADIVRGPAEDFCLVVTQRRHPADTALVTEGPVATEWLSIAQAFAGPPGDGRRPGQFS